MSREPAVLLLSSNPFTRADEADYLERCGYNVLQAKDGPQALEVLRSQRGINVLVTQVEFGDSVEGLEVAKLVDTAMGRKVGGPRMILHADGTEAPAAESLDDPLLTPPDM